MTNPNYQDFLNEQSKAREQGNCAVYDFFNPGDVTGPSTEIALSRPAVESGYEAAYARLKANYEEKIADINSKIKSEEIDRAFGRIEIDNCTKEFEQSAKALKKDAVNQYGHDSVDVALHYTSSGTFGVRATQDLSKGSVFAEANVNPYLRGAEMKVGYRNGSDAVTIGGYTNDLTNGLRVDYSHKFSNDETFKISASTNKRAVVGYSKGNTYVMASSAFGKREYFGVGFGMNF